jgi:protein phosphatase
MGTTLTLAYQLEDKLYFLHVGDSRAYLFRREKLYRLTEDHSVVFQMFKEGQISKEEMETHPLRSTLTQAIGVSPTVRADVVAVKTQPGDRYLLATDGLTSMLKDEEIEEILKRNLSLEESCQTLIEAANSKGGYDNITLVLLEIEAA